MTHSLSRQEIASKPSKVTCLQAAIEIFSSFLICAACSSPSSSRAVRCKNKAFIISNNPHDPYPYLSVLVNGKAAYLFYAPFDDSVGAGFQAYGEDEDGFELDPDENTVFYGNTPTEEIEISNEYVCSREKAIEVVLAFMDCDEWPSRYEDLPDCVEWEEL